MDRVAGSSCTMHPWVRDDCGHELYSPLLLQHIPNPRAVWFDSHTQALCVAYGAAHMAPAGGGGCWWVCVCTRAVGRGDGRVCWESVSAASILLWCA